MIYYFTLFAVWIANPTKVFSGPKTACISTAAKRLAAPWLTTLLISWSLAGSDMGFAQCIAIHQA